MPKIRLHVEATLRPGASIATTPEQAHYLLHVMRLKAGEGLAVFNARDGEFAAVVAEAGKRSASLAVGTVLRPPRPEPDVWLVFAPLKGDRSQWVAEKATELGVSALWPVFTRRTVPTRVNLDRLTANAVEAAEQCERLSVPEIRPATSLDNALAGWPEERRLLVMDETGSGTGIGEVLPTLPEGAAAILVGPEGGFAQSELDALRRLPFVTFVGLGPRILRADTAALAALACWQAWAGDWRLRPAYRFDG
jgi:16S rRNA (uracil1498-N3)-methyltransferase